MKNVLLLIVVMGGYAFAQPSVRYRVSFPNAVHFEARVEATFSGVTRKPLELRMSRTSPGRYALHEFAKNVYALTAVDGAGRSVRVINVNPHQWNIEEHDGTVRVTYTLYGDHADGTYAGIDTTHAHLNMPATFIWARGLEDAPISVEFDVPDGSGWQVASQLYPTEEPFSFTAPDMQYFMDSPTELSAHAIREWVAEDGERQYTFRLALHHSGTALEADTYAEMGKRLVEEARGVFGAFPAYETGRYTFIADYLPWVHGDGMEHRNSTILSSSRPLAPDPDGHASTLIHEAFHAWNVERIRPATLEPFNYEEANMSAELWFAEGVTSYYANLLMRRAGLKSLEKFASRLGSAIDQIVTSPGRSLYSAAEMSMKAPFNDAARSVDEQNTRNTFISYYTWGEAIGIGLDLTLRTQFPGRSLDGFMKFVWERHGRPEVPYSNQDLSRLLGEYSGDASFGSGFFEKYVLGNDVVDYDALLAKAGFILLKRQAGKAGMGRVIVDYDGGKATVESSTMKGSPLYTAGVDRGDVIVSMDGTLLKTPREYADVLGRQRPGDEIELVIEKRGATKTVRVLLEEKDFLEVVTFESKGRELSPEMQALRTEWLSSHSAVAFVPLQKVCKTCGRSYPYEMDYCGYDGERLPFSR